MKEQAYNAACLAEITSDFNNFKTEGETAHDMLLVIHTVNTPKGNANAQVQIMHSVCPCNLEPVIVHMMGLNPKIAQAIINGVAKFGLNKIETDKQKNKPSEN